MLVWLLSLHIGTSAIDSAPRPMTQLVHTRWTAKDGAPGGIRALAQTADGYLWIGTVWGLVRFDGARFVSIESRQADSTPVGGVRSLLAARDGGLWIVWGTGAVSRFRDGRMTTYGTKDGLASTYRLAESSTGTLVAATGVGLSRFQNGRWTDANRDWAFPDAECKSLWFDRLGRLWVQTERRVLYLPSDDSRFVDPGMPLQPGTYPGDFAEARDGAVWMAELSRSAHTIPTVGDRRAITEVGVGTWTLLVDRKGSLWIGSAGDGLRRVLDPARIRGRVVTQFGPEAEQFTQKDGLLSDIVTALLEDREGSIWVASYRGLERFREGAFVPVPTAGSVRDRAIFPGRDSSVWSVGVNVKGVLRLGPSGRDSIGADVFVTALFQDASGAVWATGGSGIARLRGRRIVPVPEGRSDGGAITDLTVDRSGTVWAFDEGTGLLRLTDQGLVRVAALNQPGRPGGRLFSDRQGRIWLGQPGRVVLYDRGRLRVFDASKGEAPPSTISFFEDRAGGIWVASRAGLSKFVGDRFATVPESRSVPGLTVHGIAEDDGGAWWVATPGGVLRLPPDEADRALADSSYVIRYRLFDQLDGLPGAISISSWGTHVARASDGRVWVATDSGLANVDPRRLPPATPPPVLIEAARIDGREILPSEASEIPAGRHELEVDYTATSLGTPERVQFRYRLEGADDTWRNAGARRRAYYTGLAPGRYRFRVAATLGDDVWRETPTAWSFRVLPAWYQTLWFRTGAVVLIGTLGAAAAALVQRRRYLSAQAALRTQYEVTLAERSRIAQDLHDTLLQGFAGVTLQLKTAELALPERPDVAVETIMRVQQLARQSLREARERVWDMREAELGSDDLPDALEAVARERTTGTGIEVSVACTGHRRRLAHAVEDAAFRIGREAVVNAVRHAEARRVEIAIDFRASSLRLEVRDDGRGFTPAQAEEARRNGHFGLSGARERARHLGGACDVLARPGSGTIVALELPLAQSAVR